MGTGGGAQKQAGGYDTIILMVALFAIFYFLLIRPQQKEKKQRQEMINSLKKGDRIITTGGLCGRITAVGDARITLEISDKVRVKVLRGNVAALDQPATKTPSVKNDKADTKKSK
ncbi:MAG: preprotein translocase subunit YajC [Deltaproteobacteria bacterium]|nr:preprotein translocase subunit YajC [Deltaproteobacteria bacterium]